MYGGIFSIIEKLKVKNIIIGKQFEDSENYQKLLRYSREKKIRIYNVCAGNKINIEKNLRFECIWPETTNEIKENSINNNSLVIRLNYKNFNMLFVGDIEEKAEKQILQKYKDDLKILKSTILKIAHHGSKTSSTTEFLNAIKPEIVLIGVGEKNKFGHPSYEILDRLNNFTNEIYRTDKNGEISIITDGKNVKSMVEIENK